MAGNTRARNSEEMWRELENKIQEVSNNCHKKIAENNSLMENRLIDKMDQLMSLVSGCDAKIEAYNASMEERIKVKLAGVFKNSNMEKMVGRDGEILVDKTPILQTPLSGKIKNRGDEDASNNRERPSKVFMAHQPRLELPCFMGEDPRSWIRKCNKFFLLHQVSDSSKVEMVELYLDGKADVWYQSFKMVNGKISWECFCDSLMQRFGKFGGIDVHEEFNKLSQTATVLEYVENLKN